MVMFLTIKGKVKKGAHRGGKLGFPTINVAFPSTIKKDQWGVYFSIIKIKDKFYPGATHLGPVKSFIPFKKTCETYLLTLNKDLYNQSVEKRLIFKFRDIEEFSNVKHLKKQMKKDIKAAKKYFGL